MSNQKSRTAGSFHADASDSKQERFRKFLMRNALVIVTAVVFVTVYLVLGGISSDRDADLASQRSEILSLQGQLSMNQDQVHSEQERRSKRRPTASRSTTRMTTIRPSQS